MARLDGPAAGYCGKINDRLNLETLDNRKLLNIQKENLENSVEIDLEKILNIKKKLNPDITGMKIYYSTKDKNIFCIEDLFE